MNNLITLPDAYNPLHPKNDTLHAFRWVFLSDTNDYNLNAFDWILDGWDFVDTQNSPQGFIYRLIKPNFQFPTLKTITSEKYMVNLLTESKNKDSLDDSSDSYSSSDSSISEHISIDHLQDNPLSSPLVFKNTNNNETPPMKLNNPDATTFYSAVHF